MGFGSEPQNERAMLAALLVTARDRLRIVFLAFLVGFLGTFSLLRNWVWDALEAALLARGATVVAITPFDVVLLEAKFAIGGGLLVALPTLAYLAREPLRGHVRVPWSRPKLLGITLLAAGLFVVGVAYAYAVLFPFLFGFLAANAIAAGFQPTYSIVMWAQFVLILSVVMGVAAELPLVMGALASAGIVTHETFVANWRLSVFGLVIVGSIANGSPDPFSMALVTAPLVALYGVGLVCTRLLSPPTVGSVTTASPAPGREPAVEPIVRETALGVTATFSERDEEEVGGYYEDVVFVLANLRTHLAVLGGTFVLVVTGVFTWLSRGGIGTVKRDFLARLPAGVDPASVDVVLLHPVEALAFELKLSVLVGAIAIVPLLCYYLWEPLAVRGLARGSRRALVGWAGALVCGLVVGSALGYAFVAPVVVSGLTYDALRAGIVVAYRVPELFWLVVATTVGVGLLLDVPVGMVLGWRANLVTYRTLRARWRTAPLGARVLASKRGGDGHLKLALDQAPALDAIGFGMAARAADVTGPVDLAFQAGLDVWNGRTRVSLKLRDLRVSDVARAPV
ncbi:MAG: twin-arginine translocase subunit TatC, partial [Halalkalicoccus sp.]